MTAIPLVLGAQMSPRAAETLLMDAEPNTPAKKRVMNMDWAFLLVAVPMEKMASPNIAGSIDHLLPQISEMGAQHKGPNANPSLQNTYERLLNRNKCQESTHIYRETDRTPTSGLTPTYLAMVLFAGDVMLDAKLPARASIPN